MYKSYDYLNENTITFRIEMKIGFLINPIAGMGGAVGLKGTDGEAFYEAIKRGAERVSPKRAVRFLSRLQSRMDNEMLGKILFITPPNEMGYDVISSFKFNIEVIPIVLHKPTNAVDTKKACQYMISKDVDLIIFVGGDGTARDVMDVIDLKKPVIGVPSGVKMYSAIFAYSPEAAADTLISYLNGEASIVEREVMDIDEDAYRRDILKVRLYGYLKVVYHEEYVQSGKDFGRGMDYYENRNAIAKSIVESMKPDTLYLLGPGETVKAIADLLGLEKTLLGIDAVYNNKIIARDLAEKDILKLIEKYKNVKLILSPLGGEGFLLGRGNQQLTPKVIKLIGKENIIIIATRDKISKLKKLYVDTGDPELDKELEGYYKVLVDYNEYKVMKVTSKV